MSDYAGKEAEYVVVFLRPFFNHEEGHLGLLWRYSPSNQYLRCGVTCGGWVNNGKDTPQEGVDFEVIGLLRDFEVGDIVMDTRSENTDGLTYGCLGEVTVVVRNLGYPNQEQTIYQVRFDTLSMECDFISKERNAEDLAYIDHIDETPAEENRTEAKPRCEYPICGRCKTFPIYTEAWEKCPTKIAHEVHAHDPITGGTKDVLVTVEDNKTTYLCTKLTIDGVEYTLACGKLIARCPTCKRTEEYPIEKLVELIKKS